MTDKEACERVRTLLKKEKVSETQMAKALNWTQTNFSRKLRTGTLRFGEACNVFETLGYSIELKKEGEPFALKITGGK